MGEPSDDELWTERAATGFVWERDIAGDPNVARYNVELHRAMSIQRLDMVVDMLEAQNKQLEKLTQAMVVIGRALSSKEPVPAGV